MKNVMLEADDTWEKRSRRSYSCNCNCVFKALIVFFTILLLYKYNQPRPLLKEPNFSLLGPHNTTKYVTEDTYNQLIDIRDFRFKINSSPCQGYDHGLLLLILITAKPDNYEKRRIIRNTWGRNTDTTKVLFFFGEVNSNITKKILKESQIYKDIVQGNFIDHYHNMTYKHTMALKWVVHHCPSARYILKMDDDVVVNYNELLYFLSRELSPWGAHGLLACECLRNRPPIRHASKWKVTKDEYDGQMYPAYCRGNSVIYSQDVIPKLLSKVQSLPYFWVDDVQVTGVAAEKIGIDPTPLYQLVLPYSYIETLIGAKGMYYVGRFLFSPPDLNTKLMSKVWNAMEF